MIKKLSIVVFAFLCLACGGNKEVEKPVGLELANMDTTTRPQDDLFRFVNGGWLERTTIPADRGNWGAGNELFEHNNKIVLEVLTEASTDPNYPEGTDQRKAADFYAIGMDSLLAEKAGASPLSATLEEIKNINNKEALQNYLAKQEMEGGGAFYGVGIFPDLKQADKMAVYLGSGGLGLPEREYYIKTDEKSKETREKYKEHITNMLVLVGDQREAAQQSANKILALETQLAKATLTKEESRNPYNLYHKVALKDLQSQSTTINWAKYFSDLDISEDTIINSEPAFIKEFEKIVNSAKWTDIRDYLRWTAVANAAPYLNHDFVNESFDFNNKYLNGIEELRPRWKRVLAVTDQFMGEAIGQLYVDRAFPPEAKAKAMEMVENIKLALADRIKQLEWMSDSTKRMALEKLGTFTVKIGYPDEWKSYAGLKVETAPEKSSYYQNVVNANRFTSQRQIDKLGKPVDKTEWQMTPQTVNAYYNPLFNEIVFPAGILQPPFYNYKADEAINYGGIGAVIGHEISHGFDDQGSQFDAAGNLKNWWSDADLAKFKSKGTALAEQFNKYEALPGVFVQGEFTLGENIGDLGGLNIAYEGLQRFLRENGRPDLIDGYTPEQRFFLSWGTIWRNKFRDEALRTRVNTDPHAPAMFRANGPISNMPQFYEAFNLQSGDKLYRDSTSRVKIW